MIATFFTKIFFIFYRLLKLIGVSFYMLIKAGYYHYFRNGQSDRLPVIFRRYFEVLGGGFIKVGQTLSMRYDVFPDEYCNELSGLLDDVKPFDRKRGLRIIKKEWKGRLGDFLQNEELELVASASLGQVYLGTNKSGDKVPIKIKRPYITPIILADLFYLEFLSFLFFLTGYGAKVGVTDILKELIEALKSEVNYKKETLVMETFHALSNEEKLF